MAFQNKAAVYAILFRATAETLRLIAADPRHLGPRSAASPCCTWGSGDAAPSACPLHRAGRRPLARPDALDRLPTRVLPVGQGARAAVPTALSRTSRRRLRRWRTALLRRVAPLAGPRAFAAHCAALRRINWVVYAKPPFGGPKQVLAYLGRYTHRVAIANSRLVAMTDDAVSFRCKSYRQEGRHKVMTLEPAEFIRRFLLHVLPTGFHRIRHFGLPGQQPSRSPARALPPTAGPARPPSAGRTRH